MAEAASETPPRTPAETAPVSSASLLPEAEFAPTQPEAAAEQPWPRARPKSSPNRKSQPRLKPPLCRATAWWPRLPKPKPKPKTKANLRKNRTSRRRSKSGGRAVIPNAVRAGRAVRSVRRRPQRLPARPRRGRCHASAPAEGAARHERKGGPNRQQRTERQSKGFERPGQPAPHPASKPNRPAPSGPARRPSRSTQRRRPSAPRARRSGGTCRARAILRQAAWFRFEQSRQGAGSEFAFRQTGRAQAAARRATTNNELLDKTTHRQMAVARAHVAHAQRRRSLRRSRPCAHQRRAPSRPGHPVRNGDVVTLALDRSVRVVEVSGFAERRGDAKAARLLYRD